MRARKFRFILISFVALVGLVYGFLYFQSLKGDLVLPSDTKALLVAVKEDEQGSHVVSLTAEGVITEAKEVVPGKSDRDLAWDPSGNRVFFISDRKDDSFHIFRWDAARNGAPEQKSLDRAGRSNIAFDAQDSKSGEISALVTVRGTVQQFFPQTAKSVQILPPNLKGRGSVGEDGETTNMMEAVYKRFGTSFRVAKWMMNRRYIIAVMRREEQGETLIIQDLQPDTEGKSIPPVAVFVGEKIEINIDPVTGAAVASIVSLTPPPDANGKPQKANFRHGVFIIDPSKPQAEVVVPIVLSNDDKAAFGTPVVSPKGDSLILVSGPYSGDGNIEIKGLVSMPLRADGGSGGSPIAEGAILDPTFSPDGSKIAYIKKEGSYRSIFIAGSDGSSARNVSGNRGNFRSPLFSPQFK